MDATSTTGPLSSTALRWIAAGAALVAAAVHVPVTPEHLDEAPYMGVLFIVLTVACVALAVGLVATASTRIAALAVLTCGAAIVGYVLTRSVAFPMLADDVGNWWEPLGVAAVASEAVVVAACLTLVRRTTRTSRA